MHKLTLPTPAPEAVAASQALTQVILSEIQAHGGWLSFSRYMELALYAPRLGYYSGGSTKLGKDGDFTTAPEITPLFGASLAQFAAKLFPDQALQIMEFGAGSGRLAHDFLMECQLSGIPVARYAIVELSGELRARQENLLQKFQQVVWLETMPPAFSGLVLGNEVLDAMPVQLVRKRAAGWQEVGVAASGAAAAPFVWGERVADAPLLAQIGAQIPAAADLPEDYLSEVHGTACAFMRSLAQMLAAGHAEGGQAAALLFDYGFPAAEYYLPQRSQGTLMCHYRHHAHPEPFYWPGLQDITAHVDFSAMAQAAQAGGLDLLAYTSQAGFLLDSGITDLLLRTPAEQALAYLPQANALQKLISPAEMGELFKVLLVGAGLTQLPLRHDRSHRL